MRTVLLEISAEELTVPEAKRLRIVLEQYPGTDPVMIAVMDGPRPFINTVPDELHVDSSNPMLYADIASSTGAFVFLVESSMGVD